MASILSTTPPTLSICSTNRRTKQLVRRSGAWSRYAPDFLPHFLSCALLSRKFILPVAGASVMSNASGTALHPDHSQRWLIAFVGLRLLRAVVLAFAYVARFSHRHPCS